VPDITTGAIILGADTPPAASASDDTLNLNLGGLAYAPGTPEVGIAFMAPTSGRVRITIGGGLRDNANVDRLFLAPQVFRGPNSGGVEVLAPSVGVRGIATTALGTDFVHTCRVSLLDGLIPGETYYARTMQFVSPGGGSPNGTADISCRDITVIPVS